MHRPGRRPPVGTPDVVFATATPGLYAFATDPGWTIGRIATTSACTTSGRDCSTSAYWSAATDRGYVYFYIERNDGGCGRVTVTIQHTN